MNNITIKEQTDVNGLKIAFVGIGTTGIKALNIVSDEHENIKTIAIDKNPGSLAEAEADKKIELLYQPILGLCQCKEPLYIESLLGKSKEDIDEMRKECHIRKT